MNEHSFDPYFEYTVSGSVASVTLQRPPVNAINREWILGFEAILDRLQSQSEVGVLLIRSALGIFSAGADLRLMRECFRGPQRPEDMVETVRRMQRLYDRIEALPQVVIAEIGGAALGGGLELALACDLRIAAEDASLGVPEARLGLLPGAGGTQRLTRLCGPGVARRLVLTAEVIDGRQALELGLVQWAVPTGELAARACELAHRTAALSPAALAASKRCFGAADQHLGPGMLIELLETNRLFNHADTRRRVSAFLDR